MDKCFQENLKFFLLSLLHFVSSILLMTLQTELLEVCKSFFWCFVMGFMKAPLSEKIFVSKLWSDIIEYQYKSTI